MVVGGKKEENIENMVCYGGSVQVCGERSWGKGKAPTNMLLQLNMFVVLLMFEVDVCGGGEGLRMGKIRTVHEIRRKWGEEEECIFFLTIKKKGRKKETCKKKNIKTTLRKFL